ncbi:MAG: ABC transporter permease [Prevotella sp.]|nr:ABC transporter permease [Prevotella sp.]
MNIIIHNLKVAVRNLIKYKLQTFISVLCIAIGIVTLSLAHSILTRFQLPEIYNEPYYDRAYKVLFRTINEGDKANINCDVIRAVKQNGGLSCTEQIAVDVDFNGRLGLPAEFHLPDSTVRKGAISANYIDPEYITYAGLRSAITGKKIKKLKQGEAIIEENLAKSIFRDKSPIGAVQTIIGYYQTIPVTIVDVYRPLSYLNKENISGALYYCLYDCIEDHQELDEIDFIPSMLNVVLKEECTEQQLLEEVNERVKPFGLEAELSRALDDADVNINITVRGFIYIISSLILLAAIIGFLRIQTQLFWIRRREMSLRVVNGASRMQLFSLLVTEVAISVCLSVIVAVILGCLLQDFIDSELNQFIHEIGIKIHSLWLHSLVIGGGLLVLCSLMVWITLLRICKAGKGLAASMRRSRNHLFRNIMLGIQIVISIVFVCCTFILANGGNMMLKAFNVPENDDFYKECLFLRPIYAEHLDLLDEIERLPDLDRIVMCSTSYCQIREIEENPEAVEKLQHRRTFNFRCTTDTAMLSFLGMAPEWFNRDVDRTNCLLLSEQLYNKFHELGILDKNTLTLDMGPSLTLPIAGIIKNTPYVRNTETFVAIAPDWERYLEEYVLVPKAGRSKALARSVDETIERLEPEIINKMVFNFREMESTPAIMIEIIQNGGWILGCVSLFICIMSIFSTIALDTRARKKEVAIRKVNGAKGKHIYRMFGKVYVVLIVISLFIAVPLCVMFNQLIEGIVTEDVPGTTLSPVMPILLGIAIVTLLIFLIVGWQIHKVMQVDPAKIIAKE